MSRHEHFRRLAAIAALGELDSRERSDLDVHLAACADCQRIGSEYEALHAARPALDKDTLAWIDSRRDHLKASFLAAIGNGKVRANVAGDSAVAPASLRRPERTFRFIPLMAGAAVALAGSFWLGVKYEGYFPNVSGPSEALKSEGPSALNSEDQAGEVSRLNSEIAQLKTELRLERRHGSDLERAVGDKDGKLAQSELERTSLEQELGAEQGRLRETEGLLSAKADELNRLEAVNAKDSDTVLALRYQVQDLTEKLNDWKGNLDRERQLLARGRDMRDIIGARNLHIIDVYDTEANGATKKSFARAFYTEGKSLIFYAYDLPAHRTESGQFLYTAWGQNNGKKDKVLNLGILLNDDKGQKRWVLNFSDPKVLSEIDSVFITLERVGFEGDKPTGKRLLTAYLASEANHP